MISDEELILAIVGTDSDSDEEPRNESEVETSVLSLPSNSEKLRLLSLSNRILKERCVVVNSSALQAIRQAQRTIRWERSSSARQTSITSFFISTFHTWHFIIATDAVHQAVAIDERQL